MTRWRWRSRAVPEPVGDVGLQTERTSIAWQRTALTLAGFSALVLHAADSRGLGLTGGAVGIAVALWLLVAGERRYSVSVRRRDGLSPVAPRMVRSLTVAVVAVAAMAFGAMLSAAR